MAGSKMHEDEAEISAELVHRLLVTQFPHLSDLTVAAVQSTGTVNAIYRLGNELCVRLPRVERWVDDLINELEWLPRLAGHLPLTIPEPVAKGEAGSGYPFPWAIYRWIEGETFDSSDVVDENQAAIDLASFISELRRVDRSGAPNSGRRPLIQLDETTRAAIESLPSDLDTEQIVTAWENSLRAPEWDGHAVWIHCDLLPPNLLVEGGRLRAVIDFGAAGVGDPAQDVTPAWSVFGQSARSLFRSLLEVDAPAWLRARGYALHQAVLIIPYYSETNPAFVSMARRTVAEVLEDVRSS
jgi:aminoglycoside phosphotransferase (APT) family kinase protein